MAEEIPHARMPRSLPAPEAKFKLGQQVWFKDNKENTIENGIAVGRSYNTGIKGYVYDVVTAHKNWYNVPETLLSAVEILEITE